MSVVAWDGKNLAADKLMCGNDCTRTTTKIFRVKDAVIAFTGDIACGLILLDWYKDGCKKEDYPAFQTDKEDWTRMIIADKKGCRFYEKYPIAIEVEDPYSAWGSGRDFAMGALAMGATAGEAVKVASMFCLSCGGGTDNHPVHEENSGR